MTMAVKDHANSASPMGDTRQRSKNNDGDLTARSLSAVSYEYARLPLTDPDRYTPECLLARARW